MSEETEGESESSTTLLELALSAAWLFSGIWAVYSWEPLLAWALGQTMPWVGFAITLVVLLWVGGMFFVFLVVLVLLSMVGKLADGDD